MSTTEEALPGPAVGPDTLAAWRRRRQACEEPVPAPSAEQTPNYFQATINTATSLSGNKPGLSIEESQRAGLAAMLNLSNAEAGSSSRPATEPYEPQVELSVSPRGRAESAIAALSGPVIASSPSVIDRSRNLDTAVGEPTHRSLPKTARRRPDRKTIWSSYGLVHLPGLPLIVILTVESVLSLRLVWSNTSFPDEALYLWSGHLEWAHRLHGTPIPVFSSFFSGAPVIYPPLGAIADSIGGLAGARLLSLCFMLCATALLHGVTRRVFSRRAAIFAAALFAALSATQYLGAFATYDAMALLLLAFATWLGVRAAGYRLSVQVILMIATASILTLADATKYAAALFDPIVIAAVGLAIWRSDGWRRGVTAILTILYVLCMLLTTAIRLGGYNYWQGITTTTLTRASGTYPISFLLLVSGKWIGFVAMLAIIGMIATACNRLGRVTTALAGALTIAVFLVPAEQARIHTYTSLFKHLGFGGWFACIPAGYAIASLARAVPRSKRTQATWIGVAAVFLAAVPNISWAASHYGWPNLSPVLPEIRTVLVSTHGPVLADDRGNVLDYYLPDETARRKVLGTFFFAYNDPVTSKHLIGSSAYAAAIHDHYFSVIMLEFWDTAQTDDEILRDLESTAGYRLAVTIPYRATGQHGNFMIWVRQDRL
jgi:hypothetical protein